MKRVCRFSFNLDWSEIKSFDDTNFEDLIIFTESNNFPETININIPY